jgi:TonB family protein
MGQAIDKSQRLFRRNFTVAVTAHVGLIAGIILLEGVFAHNRQPKQVAVDLVIPADIFGELPEGAGFGRGAYTAPAEPPDGEPDGGDDSSAATVPERPKQQAAPQPPAKVETPQPTPTRNDVTVPKPPAPAKPANTTAKTSTTSRSSTNKVATASAKSSTKPKTTTAKAGAPGGTGTSEADIKRRFASLLASSGKADGSAYGDNRSKGGGTGKGPLGSPDGALDGIIGGIGKGTPYWSYYLHIREKMYAAWERPGDVVGLRKGAISTVTITVTRDGNILAARITVPSGSPVMDESALAAARRVTKINPLPDGFTQGNQADIKVNFQLEG